jgi:hypothetical protein
MQFSSLIFRTDQIKSAISGFDIDFEVVTVRLAMARPINIISGFEFSQPHLSIKAA